MLPSEILPVLYNVHNMKDCSVNWLHVCMKVLKRRHQHANIILIGQRSSRSRFRLCKIQHKSKKNNSVFLLGGNSLPVWKDLNANSGPTRPTATGG